MTTTNAEARSCPRCGEQKRPIDFYRKDLHCRSCRNKAALEWYYAHPDKAKVYVKEWDERNPGVRAARSKEWYRAHPDAKREWRKKHPEKVVLQQRKSRLKSTYGITLGQFDEMLTAQLGGCAACGGQPTSAKGFHIDHDHDTGAVRGLLCGGCNSALGMVGDSRERLEKLIKYLAGDY